ncbi:MAG: fatty acid desaturase [Gammaproteobacteria bacterium]|nr:fatty acid desaturase [Gammaproteobacteria bacterium]MCD8542208.1 fatty acid desaturase [Gammaproteobacteria bacterium]
MQNTSNKVNWLNTIFLIATFVVGVSGAIILTSFGMVKWQTWAFTGVYIFMTGIAITAGYHRLFAHKSYEAHPVIAFVLAMLGSACFEGSVLEWGTDHRNHHRYVDTEKDPYNIHQGFWYAHIGWLIRLDPSKRDFSNVADLSASPLLRFQHRYFPWIAVFMGFVLPTLVCSLWGDAWAGFIVAGVFRTVFNHHSTFFINSLCHWAGKRTYTEEQTARDNWITALVTMGEGFHNFHHQFPLDYRNGIRWFHFDPTKWLIFGLSKVGLAGNLRRICRHKILQFKLRVDEARLKRKHHADSLFIHQKVEPLKAHLVNLIEKIVHLEAELASLLNATKIEHAKGKYQECKSQLQGCLHNLKTVQKELNLSLVNWRALCI